LTAESEDVSSLQDWSIVSVVAQDPNFQTNIGRISTSSVTKQKISVDIYCPKSYESSVVVLTVTASWSCYPQAQTTYELPLFCMTCDSKQCQKGSSTYFATVTEWKNKKSSTPQAVSSTSTAPVVVTASPPIAAS